MKYSKTNFHQDSRYMLYDYI